MIATMSMSRTSSANPSWRMVLFFVTCRWLPSEWLKARYIVPMFTAILLLFSGCNRYPEVASPESQELILRFYTACNTENPERLAKAIQVYEELKTLEKVGKAEQAIFDQIVLTAKKGNWQEAADLSIRFSEGQVERF